MSLDGRIRLLKALGKTVLIAHPEYENIWAESDFASRCYLQVACVAEASGAQSRYEVSVFNPANASLTHGLRSDAITITLDAENPLEAAEGAAVTQGWVVVT